MILIIFILLILFFIKYLLIKVYVYVGYNHTELKLKAPHSITLSTLSLIQDACKCSNFNFYLNYTFKCKDAYIYNIFILERYTINILSRNFFKVANLIHAKKRSGFLLNVFSLSQ